MVLPGYALMAQGTQSHIAAWPGGDYPPPVGSPVWARQLILSRAFASQGACYVIVVAGLRRSEDVPEEFRVLHRRDNPGDSCIIDPRGEVLAGPAQGETILTARGSLESVLMAKAGANVGGHYSRPDIFRLTINREPPQQVIERGDGHAPDPARPWRGDSAERDAAGADVARPRDLVAAER